MQIDMTERLCPGCGEAALEFFAVLHHMPCAYVGPAYDFTPDNAGYVCPEMRPWHRRFRRRLRDRRHERALSPLLRGGSGVAAAGNGQAAASSAVKVAGD